MACTLEIDIGRGGGESGYPVTVRGPAGGESEGILRLNPQDLLGRRGELQNSVLASTVPSTRSARVSSVEMPVRDVGRELFTSLLNGPLHGQYRSAKAIAAANGTRLRVVLRLSAPELVGLPWEMLYDDEEDAYLCKQEPLVRHVAVTTPPPVAVGGRLRVLGLVASPRDLASLDVASEKQRLTSAVAPLTDRIELVWSPSGSWNDFLHLLTAGPWHVIHFVGHGDYDEASGCGRLALENESGRVQWVRADRFRELVDVQSPAPRLIVLNSCSSGQPGVDDLFSSTAATLVRGGAAAVVAMQYAVTDDGAQAFSEALYRAIASNHSISESVRIARIGIAGPAESLEWATPVLYVRGGDAVDQPLFKLDHPAPPPPVPPVPPVPPPAPPSGRVPRWVVTAAATLVTALLVAVVVVAVRNATAGPVVPSPSSTGSISATTSGSPTTSPIATASTSSPQTTTPEPTAPTSTQPPTRPVSTPPLEAPDAIRGLTRTAVTANSITVAWSPAARAGSYLLSWRDDDGDGVWRSTKLLGSATTGKITGLQPSHAHTVQLVAVNAAGEGGAVSIQVTTASSGPGAVTGVSVADTGRGTARVSWVQVAGADGYRLSWVESPTNRQWKGDPPYYGADRSSADLTGLTPGSTYAITVVAFTGSPDAPVYGKPTTVTFAKS